MDSHFVQIVKNNLIKRAEEKKSGQSSDIKTCLVIQGGGMRASYSMGCLRALAELGYTDSFDYIVGSSAGAINGAYFLTGQTEIATKVYAEYLTNKEFINIFRLSRVLDEEYLMRILSSGETALLRDKIEKTSTELLFSTLHYPTGDTRIFSTKDNVAEVMNLIAVSAAPPAFSNAMIEVGGEKYIDGATVDPVPLKLAIDLGATDIVLVLTRSRTFRRKPLKLLYEILSRTYFKHWPKEVRDGVFKKYSEVNGLYEFVWNHEGDNKKYRVVIIAPQKDDLADTISIDKAGVAKNIQTGYWDAMAVFK